MSVESRVHLVVSSVSEQLFRGDVLSVSVPGVDGEMVILPKHEALISLLTKGAIKITTNLHESPIIIPVISGVLETSNQQITILV